MRCSVWVSLSYSRGKFSFTVLFLKSHERLLSTIIQTIIHSRITCLIIRAFTIPSPRPSPRSRVCLTGAHLSRTPAGKQSPTSQKKDHQMCLCIPQSLAGKGFTIAKRPSMPPAPRPPQPMDMRTPSHTTPPIPQSALSRHDPKDASTRSSFVARLGIRALWTARRDKPHALPGVRTRRHAHRKLSAWAE